MNEPLFSPLFFPDHGHGFRLLAQKKVRKNPCYLSISEKKEKHTESALKMATFCPKCIKMN